MPDANQSVLKAVESPDQSDSHDGKQKTNAQFGSADVTDRKSEFKDCIGWVHGANCSGPGA